MSSKLPRERDTNDHSAKSRRRVAHVFEAFSHVERRRLLTALASGGPRSDTSVFAGRDESGDENEERRVVELFHVHLPKLEEMGLVVWNEEEWVVSRGPRFEDVRPVVTLMQDADGGSHDGWL